MCRSILLASVALLAATACNRDTSAPQAAPTARVDVALTVLVVDQPEIAQAIGRLRGDWVELSGGDLVVQEASPEEFSEQQPLAADIVIYPSRYLGQLVAAQAVRPLRQSVLEDERLDFVGILPSIREAELTYGGEPYALPFGSRVVVTTNASRPPAESASLAAETSAGSNLATSRFAAAWTLLARAAPLAQHPDQLAVLFDPETMQPRIASPPFVRALEDLVSGRREAEGSQSSLTAGWRFWPPTDATDSQKARGAASHAFAIPESDEAYDWDAQIWEPAPGGISRVPLLGADGYIGSVTTSSRNPPAAFRLLVWLAGPPGSGAAAVSLAPHRAGAADELTDSALSQGTFLAMPRILEVDAYLAALDENVRRAWQGDLAPELALQSISAAWDQITDRVGRERQRAAFQKHLNLETK